MRSPIVVGRDGELETIRNALDESRAGRGGCLLILGEAGSGKTRLLREARQEALQRDMSVLTGAVPPDVSSPAFGVLTQAIRSWSRSNGLPEKELASFALGLHQVLPEWPLPAGPPELSDALANDLEEPLGRPPQDRVGDEGRSAPIDDGRQLVGRVEKIGQPLLVRAATRGWLRGGCARPGA